MYVQKDKNIDQKLQLKIFSTHREWILFFKMFTSVFSARCVGLSTSNPVDEINLEETEFARGPRKF